jgi:hypothetical protein
MPGLGANEIVPHCGMGSISSPFRHFPARVT